MFRRLIIGLVVIVFIVAAGGGAFLYWFIAGDGIRLALERQASAWLAQPVRIESAGARLFPRIGVRLGNVRIGAPARVVLATVDVSTGLMPLLSRRIEDAEVAIADSRVDMPLPFTVPATAGSHADEPAFQVVSIGAIRLRDVVVTSRGREISLTGDASLVGSRMALSGITATSMATTISAKGAIQLAPVLDAQLEATANRLDLDDLIALADAFAPDTQSRSARQATPGRIVAKIGADSVTAAGLTVPQFTTTLRVQGDRVSLSPTRFLLFGGRYEGELDMDLRDSASMTLASQVRDVDVAQLAAFGGVPDTISGKLTGNGTFTGRGTDFASILASARGSGTAVITDGTIRRLNLVRTVVLFFGRPAPDSAAASDAFSHMDARFTLARQVLTADALSLQSRDADIVAQGTLSLETTALEGRGDISLSEELSAQAGSDLYRYTREGNRIVLPARLGGDLSAPRLSIDAAAAVKRGLRNEVQERLKGLLDRFQPRN